MLLSLYKIFHKKLRLKFFLKNFNLKMVKKFHEKKILLVEISYLDLYLENKTFSYQIPTAQLINNNNVSYELKLINKTVNSLKGVNYTNNF